MRSRPALFTLAIAFALTARPHVLDVKYELAFETDVHTRVQTAFRERGILPPAILHRQVQPGAPPPREPGRSRE